MGKALAPPASEPQLIRIEDFDFDLDKDGKVDPFEQKVHAALLAADVDNSGTLSPTELVGVFKGMAGKEKETAQLSRTVSRLSCLVVLLCGALVGTSVAGAVIGGDAIKESRVPDCSEPSADPRCDPGRLVTVGTVESFVESVFDLPGMPTEQLAYLRDVTTYVDMSASAAVGGAVEATFKIAGAYKRSSARAHLVTTNGYTISLDAAARAGNVTMADGVYPLTEAPPAGGRRLETDPDAPPAATLSGKQLAERHAARRKLFGGALMTSGSFSMMSSNSND